MNTNTFMRAIFRLIVKQVILFDVNHTESVPGTNQY